MDFTILRNSCCHEIYNNIEFLYMDPEDEQDRRTVEMIYKEVLKHLKKCPKNRKRKCDSKFHFCVTIVNNLDYKELN